MTNEELNHIIRQYIKDNLTIELNNTHGWDTSGNKTRSSEVCLVLDGEVISSIYLPEERN